MEIYQEKGIWWWLCHHLYFDRAAAFPLLGSIEIIAVIIY